jgi:RNase P subunit RPR2
MKCGFRCDCGRDGKFMNENILICGKCAISNKLTIEERITIARKRERYCVYRCDQCGEEHKISEGHRSEISGQIGKTN